MLVAGEPDDFSAEVRERVPIRLVVDEVQQDCAASPAGDGVDDVIGPTGSEKASDWVPGYPFRISDVGSEIWRFEYNGDDVAAMRKKWRRDHQTGTIEYGDVTFMLPDREGVPSALQGTADIERSHVSLTLRSEQDYTKVQDLFERMPDEASSLKVEIRFQK